MHHIMPACILVDSVVTPAIASNIFGIAITRNEGIPLGLSHYLFNET